MDCNLFSSPYYSDNKLLIFLLFIALCGDALRHFGSKRVAPSIQHYFLRMFQPMLEEIRDHPTTYEVVNTQQIEKQLLNMKMVEFLKDDSLMDCSVCNHWIEMDAFNSIIIPRQYFIMAMEHRMNTALWIMQLLSEVGIPVCSMLLYDGLQNRNFDRTGLDFIPRISNGFTLQFLAVWTNNMDVVKWCLGQKSLKMSNPVDSLFSQ